MGYYDFPHTRNYDTDLGYLIDWFITNKNKIEENTAITIEKALIATEKALEANNSAVSAQNNADITRDLKNQTQIIKDLMQSKLNQIDTNTNRINQLATIDQGSITTTADAELVDIRVGANDVTYPSAGDSVRSQLEQKLNNTNNVPFTINGYIDNNGNFYTSTDTKVSDYIIAKGNELEYKLYQNSSGSIGLIVFYDSNFNIISIFTDATGKSHVSEGSIAIPKNAKYYRCTKWYRNLTESDYYVKEKITSEYVINNLPFNIWQHATISCFGDSITWQDSRVYGDGHTESGKVCFGYLSWLRQLLNAYVYNKGSDGATMPELLPKIEEYDVTIVDCLTINAGANDFRTDSEEIGELLPIGSVFNRTTFIGALQCAIESILTRNSNCKIVLITPIKCYKKVNGTLELISIDYINAIKQVAELYSLPVCDWFNNALFNNLTLSAYNGDIDSLPYKLHPNNNGYKQMGFLLANTIKSI